MKDYNHSKPNPENSSVIQALLDIKASGAPAPLVNDLLDILRNDAVILQDADNLFKSHQYPKHVLDWCKVKNDVEFSRFLSPKATALLTAMYQNMWVRNLIQLSHRDIIRIAKIGSLSSVRTALDELIENGCIAVKLKGTTRRPDIYMVNPLIATVGSEISYLKEDFWELTGTKYYYDKESGKTRAKYSKPHKKWKELTANRTYSKGRNSLEVKNYWLTFYKINEAPIKTGKRKSKTGTGKKTDKSPKGKKNLENKQEAEQQTDKAPIKKRNPKTHPDTEKQADKQQINEQRPYGDEDLPFI